MVEHPFETIRHIIRNTARKQNPIPKTGSIEEEILDYYRRTNRIPSCIRVGDMCITAPGLFPYQFYFQTDSAIGIPFPYGIICLVRV